MTKEQNITKAHIKQIREELQISKDPLKILENAFAGRHAILISCGPSMKYWREVYEREKDNNPLIVCVKQSIHELGDLCDLHFMNAFNHRKYRYSKNPPISLYEGARNINRLGKYDVNFDMITGHTDISHSLAATRKFDVFTMRNTCLSRPWGPGIIHEAVLYTLQHIGVKRIVTVGWDIADNTGGNTHHYDQKPIDGVVKLASWRKPFKILNKLPAVISLRIGFKNIILYLKFHSGMKCNSTAMLPGEAELVASSMPDLINWLNSEGIEIEIITNSKWMKTSVVPTK